MDRGVSMPNLLEPKASISFSLDLTVFSLRPVFFFLKTGLANCIDQLSVLLLFSFQIYPYEILTVTNRGRVKLPRDVDRTNLEVEQMLWILFSSWILSISNNSTCFCPSLFCQCHLSPDSFFDIFGMEIQEFHRLPLWKRNDMKKKADLFWVLPPVYELWPCGILNDL